MKLASQEVSGEKKRRLRIMPGVSCCDEVFLRNAKLRSLNGLTYQAREESNLMQLLRALHIYRLHKQVIHILSDVPLCTEIANNIILESCLQNYALSYTQFKHMHCQAIRLYFSILWLMLRQHIHIISKISTNSKQETIYLL